jgi:PncC family amidohydrolase
MMKNLVEEVGGLLLKENLTISVAESMTGGLLSEKLTSISGSSGYFMGSVVVYSYYAKERLLSIPRNIIEKYGVISKEIVELLARNVSDLFRTDIGLSISGNAGPISQENKPIGVVYSGIYFKGDSKVFEEHFSGSREQIREQASDKILERLLEFLKGGQ